jgi:hypothetical protein
MLLLGELEPGCFSSVRWDEMDLGCVWWKHMDGLMGGVGYTLILAFGNRIQIHKYIMI